MKKIKNKKFLFISIFAFILIIISAFFYLNNKTFKIYLLENKNDLDQLINQASKASFVLLGESSHGTADYYIWRKKISQRLIDELGFSFVLVEGDWDALYKLNLYVKHLSDTENNAYEIMKTFNRWPTWMWANYEFLEFIEWLREYNANLKLNERIGVYGMDVYGLNNSMKEIIDYYNIYNSDLALKLEDLYSCLLQYEDDFSLYVYDLYQGINHCQENVNKAYQIIYENKKDTYQYFKIIQDAKVVIYGEKHYRYNLSQDSSAWNARVLGMQDRLNELVNYYGEKSKAIVWAHNTHIGDARATDMKERGNINIGQLLRKEYGSENIYIVGFSTYGGTVLTSLAWQETANIFMIPRPPRDSLEFRLGQKENDSYYILLNNNNLPDYLQEKIGHRAKGVVYNPLNDRFNYVETIVNQRYDALIFINKTSHLSPIK